MPNDTPIKPLDRIDFDLVAALSNNARMSNKELAAKVQLSPSTCLLRVRRLVNDGVISGFHAEVAPAAVGAGIEAMLMIRLREHSAEHVASMKEHFVDLPEAMVFYHVAGSVDFMVHIAVRDTDHLRKLVMEKVAGRPEVSQVETALVFEVERSTLPIYR